MPQDLSEPDCVRCSLPIYVEQDGAWFRARPLFHASPWDRSHGLERTLSRLTGLLRTHLRSLQNLPRADDLAAYLYSPQLRDHRLNLTFFYQKRTARVSLLAVTTPGPDRTLVYLPTISRPGNLVGLWLDLASGESLEQRVAEALELGFRSEQLVGQPEAYSLTGRAWTSEVLLELDLPGQAGPPDRSGDLLAMLCGRPLGSGADELSQVGRNLSGLGPDELSLCLHRQSESERLRTYLEMKERQSVLLVGPPRVGKTALVHELVRCLGKRDRVWHLSPQRLIAGMSYVGQWETRLIRILKYAEERDLVLCFDDLPGLLVAGVSSSSTLSVGGALTPYLSRRRVRVVAECTAEQLAVVQEQLRALADAFAVVRLDPTTPTQTLSILCESQRRMEQAFDCRFEPEALFSILDLQRRYQRELAFPGKAVEFLHRIGTRSRSQTVGQDQVLEHFVTLTGLQLKLMDERARLTAAEVRDALRARVVGQDEAIDAMVEVVCRAKARLNDPSRPLGSLLFVGPSGVGKTRCAQVLAEYLFGDEGRLVRFDLNEYVAAGSATRLVGGPGQGEGLLTGAVRRQPFCVVLLDELEKAHAEVFQLLLQVLGDGRLTDHEGRTADFTQALVIMTSNLGAQGMSRQLGLRSRSHEQSLGYVRAVEQFFAPEFFNRLDRVVAFCELTLEQVKTLARRALETLLARQGLVRRQAILQVDEETVEAVARAGFQPGLGARAMTRAVEQEVVAPVARSLAAMPSDLPSLIRVRPGRDGAVAVNVVPLEAADSLPFSRDLERLEARTGALEERLQGRSVEGTVDSESLDGAALDYYLAREALDRVQTQLRRIRSPHRRRERRKSARYLTRPPSGEPGKLIGSDLRRTLRGWAAELPELLADQQDEARWAELAADLAWLTWLLDCGPLAAVRPQLTGHPGSTAREWLRTQLYQAAEEISLQVRGPGADLYGPGASRLLAAESGIHLFVTPEGRLDPVLLTLPDSPSPRVIRVYDPETVTVDLRTGWSCRGLPGPEEYRNLWLSACAWSG